MEDIQEKEKKEKEYQLIINIKIWGIEKEGLYDFTTAKPIKQFNYSVDRNCYYFQNIEFNKIRSEEQNSSIKEELEVILFYVRKSFKKIKKFEIINPVRKFMKRNDNNIFNLNKRIWYIIRSDKNTFYQYENEDY